MQVQRQPNLHDFRIDSNKIRCGCYVSNPDPLNYPNKYVMVPLRHIDYNIKIVNSLTEITLVQRYVNNSDKWLQLEYSFPIHPRSCIYHFTAQFGTTKIEGVVKEKQQAKNEYKKALMQGKQTAYGQIDDKSGDIMNMKIGNVPSQTQVTITISILQELSLSLNTFYLLHIVSTISPRYINDISQLQIQQKQKQSGKAYFTWNFKIELKTHRKVIFFDSPTHNITLLSINQTGTEAILVMSKQSIPNKDFKFYFTTQDFQIPSYVLGRTDNSSTVMLSFIPKFCTLSIDDAYKASVSGKKYQTELQNAKGEYIFVLDRSGSMAGTRIKKAKQALVLFLKSLPNDCFFNIVSFGSSYQQMFLYSSKYTDEQVNMAIKNVQVMEADMGGTEIQKPLFQIFSNEIIQSYPRHIFLLTDGGVTNTNIVIELVGKNTKYSRVHSIGIGNGASTDLIIGCAEKGKGNHVFISDYENPSEKIIGLLSDSLSPTISKVSLKFDQQIIQSVIPNPQSIPYILKDQIINFYVTFKGQIDRKCEFTFGYTDSQNKLPFASKIIVNPQSQSQTFVDKMAHSKIIKNLQLSHKQGIKIEELMYYVKITDKKSQAIKQSIKSQILSEFTAFICIGKQLIDGKYQQFKNQQFERIKIQPPVSIQQQQKFMQFCYRPPKSSIQQSFSLPSPPTTNSLLSLIPPPPRMNNNYSSSSSSLLPPPPPINNNYSSSLFSLLPHPPPLQMNNNYSSSSSSLPPLPPLPIDFRALPPIKISKLPPPPPLIGNVIQIHNQSQKNQIKFQSDKKKVDFYSQPNQTNKGDILDFLSFQQLQSSKNQKKIIDFEDFSQNYTTIIQQQKKTSISIEQIIKMQKSEGSWDNPQLFKELFFTKMQEIRQICERLTEKIVLSYLVAKWIEKHYPQKQYSLLMKKAFGWVNKQIKENGLNPQQLKNLDLFI